MSDTIIKIQVFMLMNLQESIRRILREETKKALKKSLFKYWDKNGPSVDIGKYFSLPEEEVATYLIEYHGDDLKSLVQEKVKSSIDNYHSCDGDEFNLRFESIHFNVGEPKKYQFYNVNFSIDYNSNVLQNNFDFEDQENLLTLYGQLEECVENMLNRTVYENYGILAQYCMVTGLYFGD